MVEANGGDESKPKDGSKPPAEPPTRASIGGMVRDPRDRDVKTGPSLTAFLRDRLSTGIGAALVAVGLRRPRNPDDVATILLDPSKTEEDFDWQVTTPLEVGVAATIDYYKSHGIEQTFTHLKPVGEKV